MNTVSNTQTTKYKIQVQIQKPVTELEIIEVSKRTYNTIRSFVESSSKLEYEWNTGIRDRDKVVFVKTGKWKLVISVKEEYEEGEHIVTLVPYNSVDDILAIYSMNNRLVLRIEDKEFDLRELEEGRKHRIAIINRDVPFARPITIAEILDKILEYVEIH